MTIDIIKKLYYEEGMSAREIGEKINKTVWQVIRMMRKNRFKMRKNSETQKIQFNKKPLSYKFNKNKLSTGKRTLLLAGLMLYWAEGSKTQNGVVDLANSNIKMLLIFLKMLREIFNVTENKLRVYLYCYANQKPNALILFWSDKLKIPQQQFTKPYIRNDFKEEKRNKMPYGLVHIRYNDKRLFMKILEEIDIMADNIMTC